jgi:hypothetical protein
MRGALKWRTMMRALAQFQRRFLGIVPGMAGEDEIGGRGQHLEAERLQSPTSLSRVAITLRQVWWKNSSSSMAATAPAMARRSSG